MAARRTPADRAALSALGITVRDLRNKRGLSQEAFGSEIGLHRTYIGGIERGERNPTFTTMRRIAEGLGVDPATLLRHVQNTRGWKGKNGA